MNLVCRLLHKPTGNAATSLLLLPSRLEVFRGMSRKLREKLNIPQPPKRPPTPYILYFSERCKAYNNKTQLSGSELAEEISKEWSSMTDEKQEKYREKYAEIVGNYHGEKKLYDAELPKEQRGIYRKEYKRLFCCEKHKYGKPKQPQNVFLLFQGDYTGAKADIVNKYKQLTDSERLLYIARSKKDGIRYKEEMEIWELEMMIEGNFHVVRKETLKSRGIKLGVTSINLSNDQLAEYRMEREALVDKYNKQKPISDNFIHGSKEPPNRVRRERKSTEAHCGKPVRPWTSFHIFMTEQNGLRFNEIMLKWKGISEREKAAYVQKSNRDIKRYQEEMELWEDRMIAEKKFHMVRQKTLKSRGIALRDETKDLLEVDKS